MDDTKALRVLRHQYLEKLLDTIKLEFSDNGLDLAWRAMDMSWLHEDPINIVDNFGQFKENPAFSIHINGYAQDDCLDDFDVNSDLKVIEKFVADISINFFSREPYPIEGKRVEFTNWANHMFYRDVLVDPELDDTSKKVNGLSLTLSLRERQ